MRMRPTYGAAVVFAATLAATVVRGIRDSAGLPADGSAVVELAATGAPEIAEPPVATE